MCLKLVDKVLGGRKLAEIDIYLNQVREFSKVSVPGYRSDWRTQRIVERTLQILIEVCIDIANHIISDQGMRLPTGYVDTFAVLGENRVLSKSLSRTMEKITKFRNVVVHQYEKNRPVNRSLNPPQKFG